jgi:hypothetical protein
MQVISFFNTEGQGFTLPDGLQNGLEQLMAEDWGSKEDVVRELPDLLSVGTPLDAIFIAVNEQDEAVGMCTAELIGSKRWALGLAFVTESLRGQRVFSFIMNTIKESASARGIYTLDGLPSNTAPEYWRPALGRWGFREIYGKDDEWRLSLPRKENI